MSARPAKPLLASVAAQAGPARPTPVQMSAGVVGHAGSQQALDRLKSAMAELKAMATAPILNRAVAALQADDFKTGADLAIEALGRDETNGYGWYLLAIARERAGDFASSLQAYEAALSLLPDQAMIANDLGRLAYRMGMKPVAEQLFRHFLAAQPEAGEAANNLACALRDQGRYGEAVEVLRPAILREPHDWTLWNTMGTIVSEQGDLEGSLTFFEEALRIAPHAGFKARYNRGNAKVAMGRLESALEDCEIALAQLMAPPDRAMMRLARSSILLGLGRLAEGWEEYEARFDPQFADVTQFLIDRPRWTPDDSLRGKTLAVIGEQGLGDEVLFGSVLPQVIEALGPDGRLILAVEQRLVRLFQRAFPQAVVGPHVSGGLDGRTVRGATFVEAWEKVDLWSPIGSLTRGFRKDLASFPTTNAFLKADPGRVAHWRAELAKLGPAAKVGILWKSLKLDTARFRFFSPFAQWRTVLATPGVQFVNLQYGETDEELTYARDELGVDIWTPPGIDLKADLDEVAALSCALDLIIAPANATTNIAAACGASVWLISTPGAWPRLGTPHYPWYPSSRTFLPPAYGAWDEVMDEIAQALAAFRS